MKVYKDIDKIAELNEEIVNLINNLEENGHLYDCDGNRLDNHGLIDNDYYCCQHTGCCEDDFYGILYYATEEEGMFVAVPFVM